MQVSLGIHAMHSLHPPLIHRNIHTSNVFLTFNTPLSSIPENLALSHPLAKIGGFGLSQFGYPHQSETKERGVIGRINPYWIAPEVLDGRPQTVQADVYSLGMVMWEIKYRKRPFGDVVKEDTHAEGFAQMILRGERPEVNRDDSFDRLCADCWTPNPLHRPNVTEVVEILLNLIKEKYPSDRLELPPVDKQISMTSTRIPSIASHFLKCVKSTSVEASRITCAAFSPPHIWFGCRNGNVGSFNTESEEIHFANDDEIGTKSLVQSIQSIAKSKSVWTGNNCGDLIVWNESPSRGHEAAERIWWKGDAQNRSYWWPQGTLTLSCGCIIWRSTSWNTVTHTLIQDILSVDQIDPSTFSVVTQSDVTTYVCDDAANVVRLIQRCQFDNSQKLVLTKRSQRRISVNDKEKSIVIPVISLAEIDANAWSLDGRLTLTEWTMEMEDLLSDNVIRPLRCLTVDGSVLIRDGCPAQPVGLWCVCDNEVWIGVGSQFVIITKSDVILSDGPPLIQRDCIQNGWPKVPSQSGGTDLMILCAVTVPVTTTSGRKCVELWESTSLGVVFIWSVEEGIVKRTIEVGRMLSYMIVVEDEVFSSI